MRLGAQRSKNRGFLGYPEQLERRAWAQRVAVAGRNFLKPGRTQMAVGILGSQDNIIRIHKNF